MLKKLLILYVMIIPYEVAFLVFLGKDTILKPYRILGMLIMVIWGMGLSIKKYTFHCRFKTEAILPDYLGSTLRGALGWGLWH